jgi:hypothetical protein
MTDKLLPRIASILLLIHPALLEFVFFFPFAAVLSLMAGVLTIGAWILTRQAAHITA